MQDYRAGHLIGSTPRAMTYAQLMGAPIGAAALAWSYPLLVSTYGIVGENARLAAPTARRAAGFAEVLSGGVDRCPQTALIAAGIAIVLGIVFALMELNKSCAPSRRRRPALSIGALHPLRRQRAHLRRRASSPRSGCSSPDDGQRLHDAAGLRLHRRRGADRDGGARVAVRVRAIVAAISLGPCGACAAEAVAPKAAGKRLVSASIAAALRLARP